VNRWLGGYRGVWRALRPFLDPGRVTRVLDIGAGPGLLGRALERRAARGGAVAMTAMDRSAQVLTMAPASMCAVAGDALALPFRAGAFDVAILALTLHHVPDALQCDVLREAGRVARTVLVSELHRARPHYVGARLLADTIWRTNALCREDGPVSVLRGYTEHELLALAEAAGLRHARVARAFFYRFVLVAEAPVSGP
jgi:SAM-dependent methyltransferase